MSKFLDFIIVSPNDVEQDYPSEHLTIIQQEDFSIKVERGKIYGFLSKYDMFASPTSLRQINQVFIQYHQIAGAYTDQLIEKDEYTKRIYHPSNITNQMVNSPIFLSGEIQPEFNNELKYLQCYDMIKELKDKVILCHIPKPLILSKVPVNSFTVQQDLYLIQQNQ